ncbi:MAG: NAD(P)/FAD-dependent oxidoreductase [Oscillospiraceae bacterium]|nr:NAD(P)/FAD-dependent oxidoreductase [Oscillospiraceae bacterium]
MKLAYDVIIIGAGIIGGMTAYRLSRYDLRVLVVDQADDIGEGSTKANSGVLYPGFHPRGGSLKGISCVRGNAMYDEICRELEVTMQRTGCLYVAFSPDGEALMEEKYHKGRKNGVPGMEILSGSEARKLEPMLSGAVTRALYAPGGGIISPFQLLLALTQTACQNGVDFRFGTKVTEIHTTKETVVVGTNRGQFTASHIINAAGEDAAVLESLVRPQELQITPRRGQFLIFDKSMAGCIRHVLYQAQDNQEGGTLLAPTVDGNLIAGPTSENVPSYRHTETTQEGLAHIARVVKKLTPDLEMRKVITSFAGIRTNISNLDKEHKDFMIRESAPRVLSVLGIKSPGMTSAPYLAELIVQRLAQSGLVLADKAHYRTAPPVRPFLQEREEVRQALYRADPRNAAVICRCEGITEGDILRVLAAPLPPRSLNGLKKRLRIGMGRCQGGFCTGRVIAVLSRELRCDPSEVMKSLPGSNLVKGRVK